jgi:hypothetical protein
MSYPYKLERGEEYKLFGSKEDIGHLPPNVPPRYVRKERFKDGAEWETFFSHCGGELIVGSESGWMDTTLLRMRIPVKDISYTMNGNIFVRASVVSYYVNSPEDRTPLVDSWLQEVADIERELREREVRAIRSSAR